MKCRAGDDVDPVVGERAAETRGAAIGDQMNRNAALIERGGKRFGGKQVTARAAGGRKHRCKRFQAAPGVHHTAPAASRLPPPSLARGRSRVSATSMPMP